MLRMPRRSRFADYYRRAQTPPHYTTYHVVGAMLKVLLLYSRGRTLPGYAIDRRLLRYEAIMRLLFVRSFLPCC